MANEATVRAALSIRVGNIDYQSRPSTFLADVAEGTGPTPGEISVGVNGTDVDLTAVTTPGLCFLQNRDDTNYVDYGVYDPESAKFYPLGRLLAGECFVLRLSPRIESEYGTGTGTTGPTTNTLRMQANGAACRVLVEVFGA